MSELSKLLIPKLFPEAEEKNFVKGDGYRITVLTDRLFRVEIRKNGSFNDEATQTVWYRNFPVNGFTAEQSGETLLVTTDRSVLAFSVKRKKVVAVLSDGKPLSLKKSDNLKGTCRTLDMRIGKVKLSQGVISKNGAAFLEDKGLVLKSDGTLSPAPEGKDFYVFAYGNDYKTALYDFYRLTGFPPMLPRFVLGNWWSRYRAYTQEEYLSLMDRFAAENIPLTVATVDMDWHWVDVNKQFGCNYKSEGFGRGPGWTGYSWNTDLFPNYREFLSELKKRNLKVTLNLHPATGVRFYEDSYEEMAQVNGIDPASKQTVPFDLSSKKFLNSYFDILHHPYEDEGVAFWWIDWQQGKKSTVPGLDPLWALNHYHYLDNARHGRGVILSRYAGAGSHRYPLGFSGDSVTYWKSLDFQPYMTATAANIGYGWWSHDIGGHTFGVYNDELYLRWCQFGVFSPINRLHSTSHDLQGKEPWRHSETVRRIVSDYLRLRHRLIPYIYSEMRSESACGGALCLPVYYDYPEKEEAYKIKNEYFFGSQLLVCPVTSHQDKKLNMSKVDVWLPEGRWTDIFTGRIYKGGKILSVFRDAEYIPVFAKEGAILPLSADDGNACGNPEKIEIRVYRGNNSYTLYEDDGETNKYLDGEYAETLFTVAEDESSLRFTVGVASYGEGNENFRLPENREYTVVFKDIKGGEATVNGEAVPFDGSVTVKEGSEIVITDYVACDNGDKCENIRLVLCRYQAGNLSKMFRYRGLKELSDPHLLLAAVKKRFPKNVYLAAKEVSE